jgi:hypothetical protein
VTVAWSLADVMEFNASVVESDCVDPRGPAFVAARVEEILDVLGCRSLADFRSLVDHVLEQGGYPTTPMLVSDNDRLGVLREAACSPRSENNPRRLRPDASAVLGQGWRSGT